MQLFDHLPHPFLFGVVHLAPLPGAPRHGGDMGAVLRRAEEDTAAYVHGGIHGLVVENFGDAPFHADAVPPETVAALTLAVARVRELAPHLPVGVNVLRNDARAALGVTAATGAAFIRVNVHTGTMWTDQGPMVGDAARTMRERARLVPGAAVFADVHVKHAVPPPGERLVDAAEDAWRRGLADALVLSGRATGAPPAVSDVAAVRAALGTEVRLVLGSGVGLDNVAELLAVADGAIVGTALKLGGRVDAPVDPERVRALVSAASRSRSAARNGSARSGG